MAGGKKRPLVTRSLGAEPERPDIPGLSGWVAKRREEGEAGDLTAFLLETALAPQIGAGIIQPCAGGRFCKDRLLSAFAGVADGVIVGETEVAAPDLTADASACAGMKKGVSFALPAPHVLGLSDSYYGDPDEAATAVSALYRSAMRSMRDAGVTGHVLLCDRADDAELSALARQKVFFFCPGQKEEDLALLMEYQQRIAVERADLPTLFSLSGEYDLKQLILVDADAEAIASALSRFDPDQVLVGGYCTAEPDRYWNDLAAHAFYRS